MLWLKELFGTEKPIIAMLHLDALPGDPDFCGSTGLEQVVQNARRDLLALQEGGVDGILFSNEGSLPYEVSVSYVTPSAMAYVIGRLRKDIRLPFGVDCLADAAATLDLAKATGASFAREIFSGCYVDDGGFYTLDQSALLRRKADLGLDSLKLFHFLNPEAGTNLDSRPLPAIANSLLFKTGMDALCISADAAGGDVTMETMAAVKAAVGNRAAVICNTGCRKDTILSKLQVADAAIVGTTFKKDGDFHQHVDPARVAEFMDIVRGFRSAL